MNHSYISMYGCFCPNTCVSGHMHVHMSCWFVNYGRSHRWFKFKAEFVSEIRAERAGETEEGLSERRLLIQKQIPFRRVSSF